MRKAWIALSALSLVAAIGCQEGPESVSQVPGPAPYDSTYDSQLGPVALQGGQQQGIYDSGSAGGANGGVNANANNGSGANSGVPSVGGSGGTYIIKEHDTLWSIAVRIYGDGQKHQDILRANPDIDPQRLAVGQEINLP